MAMFAWFQEWGINSTLRSLDSARRQIARDCVEHYAFFDFEVRGPGEGYFASMLYPSHIQNMQDRIGHAEVELSALESKGYEPARISDFQRTLEEHKAFIEENPTSDTYLEQRLDHGTLTPKEQYHISCAAQQKESDTLMGLVRALDEKGK